VHWVEVEGIPHDPEPIRDSIHMTQWYRFDRMPETFNQISDERNSNPEFRARAENPQRNQVRFSAVFSPRHRMCLDSQAQTSNQPGLVRFALVMFMENLMFTPVLSCMQFQLDR
jgi:hypothetical protein